LTVNMRYKMANNIKFVITRFVFFQAQNAPKSVFDRARAMDPAGGAYDAPPDPLVGWGGGYPSPFLSTLDASNSASVLRPPQHKNPGSASVIIIIIIIIQGFMSTYKRTRIADFGRVSQFIDIASFTNLLT